MSMSTDGLDAVMVTPLLFMFISTPHRPCVWAAVILFLLFGSVVSDCESVCFCVFDCFCLTSSIMQFCAEFAMIFC